MRIFQARRAQAPASTGKPLGTINTHFTAFTSIDPAEWPFPELAYSRMQQSSADQCQRELLKNYAAQDLLFPDRATFTFLTGLVVIDIESMCAVAGVWLAPSSDVLRISR